MQDLSIGEKIKFFRIRTGKSQLDLEFNTGMSPGCISRIENNLVNPTKETLFAISKALELTPDEQAHLLGIPLPNKIDLSKSIINFYRDTICSEHIESEKIYETLGHLNIGNIELTYGKNTISEMCNRTLDYAKNELFFMLNNQNWRNVFKEEYSRANYIPQRMRKQIFIKTISTKDSGSIRESQEDRILFRDSRFISESFNTIHSIGITENSTFIFECSEPYKTFVIHSKEFSDLLRDMFNYFWSAAEIPSK